MNPHTVHTFATSLPNVTGPGHYDQVVKHRSSFRIAGASATATCLYNDPRVYLGKLCANEPRGTYGMAGLMMRRGTTAQGRRLPPKRRHPTPS